jgi:hypothetical protein
MTITDTRGVLLSGADARSANAFSEAVQDFAAFRGDPLGSAERMIADSPDFLMAHALKAWLFLLGGETAGLAAGKAALADARGVAANVREFGHLAALEHLAEGRMREASQVMADVAIEHPHDMLALVVGHQLDFFTGDARMLRDRIARALPVWSPSLAGHSALRGMYAFGLEENGDYAAAERHGRAAVEADACDGWARHAVAHVLEMQGRHVEGVRFLREDPDLWSTGSFMAAHNWWHLALYHLELGQVDEVLQLVDGPITITGQPQLLDLIDRSAMLWRLHLRGVDLGERWSGLAAQYEQIWAPGFYAFNDLHAVMAFLGAGRRDLVAATLDAQKRAAGTPTDNAVMSREIGLPLIRAFVAFSERRYADTVRVGKPIRNVAIGLGGSNAQRDVIDLTLIEAALRADDRSYARALAAERLSAKHESPLAQLLARRAGLGGGAVPTSSANYAGH